MDSESNELHLTAENRRAIREFMARQFPDYLKELRSGHEREVAEHVRAMDAITEELSAITRRAFAGGPVTQIYNSSPLFSALIANGQAQQVFHGNHTGPITPPSQVKVCYPPRVPSAGGLTGDWLDTGETYP